MANQGSTPNYKKLAVIFLVIWLVILPVAMLVQTITRFVTAQAPEVESVEEVVNILSFLMGIYFFFGWIPVLIFYIKSKKQLSK